MFREEIEKTQETLAQKVSKWLANIHEHWLITALQVPISASFASQHNTSNSSSKSTNPPPTGPRTHKKPRTYLSPEPSGRPRPESTSGAERHSHRSRSGERKERPTTVQHHRSAPMEVDVKKDKDRDRTRSDRERFHGERERSHEKSRDRGNDWNSYSPRGDESGGTLDSNGFQIRGSARNRGLEAPQGRHSPRRNGNAGSSGSRPNGLPNRPDRGLAERMGL
jgi:hypothetical protein